jgi:4-hydroxyphenylpyruvate dioxygenase
MSLTYSLSDKLIDLEKSTSLHKLTGLDKLAGLAKLADDKFSGLDSIELDYLEFYVGNAKQAALYYSQCFGFAHRAYRGLETGERKVASYLLEQGEIRFLLSSALTPDHPIAQSVAKHGDTVAVVALRVQDVAGYYHRAIAQGAVGAIPPTQQTDDQGTLRYAAIHSYGDTLIQLIDRRDYHGCFAPGFRAPTHTVAAPSAGLRRVDHIVGNVEQGQMDRWVEFLMQALGFDLLAHFDDRLISTDYSALMSKVVQSPQGKIKLPINEPAPSLRQSQIDEYLSYHQGPGVQHIALATDDIISTVKTLRQSGVEFLPIPQTYYDDLEDWVQDVDVPVEALAELGILIDRDAQGYLLQLFTKPVGDRPTLFFEIIERRGCQGFGAGNFKSLFTAMEREQAARQNL